FPHTVRFCVIILISIFLNNSFIIYLAPTPTKLYPLSLHDALPILKAFFRCSKRDLLAGVDCSFSASERVPRAPERRVAKHARSRSEEHTSELQSLRHLVCRLLLEKKNSSSHDSL